MLFWKLATVSWSGAGGRRLSLPLPPTTASRNFVTLAGGRRGREGWECCQLRCPAPSALLTQKMDTALRSVKEICAWFSKQQQWIDRARRSHMFERTESSDEAIAERARSRVRAQESVLQVSTVVIDRTHTHTHDIMRSAN